MLLTPEVLTLQLLNAIFFIFATLTLFDALKIARGWDLSATTHKQYTLEKRSYLSATIIKFIFLAKIVLFLFFIFTLDNLSDILHGAMCAAGVVNATDYGNYLFVFKVLNLYLFAYWIALNHADLKHTDLPYTRWKFILYTILYTLFVLEIAIEFIMFYSINTDQIVDCCGSIYSASQSSYFGMVLSLSHTTLLGIYYANFFLIVLAYVFRKKLLFTLANILFILTSIITLITFFGTYIYELPSHHCPFCFLQKEYYFVGYLLYILLFLGTFKAITAGFIPHDDKVLRKEQRVSLFFTTLYLLIVSLYPVLYYFKNGVFL